MLGHKRAGSTEYEEPVLAEARKQSETAQLEEQARLTMRLSMALQVCDPPQFLFFFFFFFFFFISFFSKGSELVMFL